MPIVQKDGRLHGPGTFDMKAGISIAMLAARALLAIAPRLPIRVVMLWTTDEEVGSRTGRPLLEAEARKSKAVFVLEPSLPGGAVKTSRKGVGEFTLEVGGVAAHAGIDPGKGVSAVHELAQMVNALAPLNDLARGTSVNVGVFEGGTRSNVIAERARAIVDVRVPSADERRRVDAFVRALQPKNPRATLAISGGIDRPPLERTRRRRPALRAGARGGEGIGAGAGRRRHRRRVGRKLHGRDRRPNIRRPRGDRRRRARRARTRRNRVPELADGAGRRPDRPPCRSRGHSQRCPSPRWMPCYATG